jgi:hypothetical protein
MTVAWSMWCPGGVIRYHSLEELLAFMISVLTGVQAP